LPDRVALYEVGPRDGLQNEKSVVNVAVKAEFVQGGQLRPARRGRAAPVPAGGDRLHVQHIGSRQGRCCLLDDLVVTGSTMILAARVLRNAGASDRPPLALGTRA
jgi:hypothetical protein